MEQLCEDYECLGPLGRKEKIYIALLAFNLLLWCTTGIHGLPLATAAVLGSMLFALPGVSLISWEQDNHKIGWDILFLVGSANSLGVALWQNGAATWIADTFLSGMSSLPLVAVIAVILPPVAAIAAAMGINPALLALPLGFSVSAAVLLPLDSVSLVTYQAGYYKMTDMFKPGLIISVAWVVITVAVMYLIARPLGLM